MNGLNMAIVLQAVKDYIHFVLHREDQTGECNLAELDNFFKSDWCADLLMFSSITPNNIIEMLHAFKAKYELEHKFDGRDESCIDNLPENALVIRCIETGKIYFGVREAARCTGLSAHAISKCINGEIKQTSGTHWECLQRPKVHPNQFTGRKIRCIETGVVYDSVRKASDDSGINRTRIGECARGKAKHAGGLRWEYVEDDLK